MTMPDSFLCPISSEVMTDPVVTADGHTYERAGIRRWLESHGTSPSTGATLANKELTPNYTLRKSIEEWREKYFQELPRNQPPRDTCNSHPGEPKKIWCETCARCICRDCKMLMDSKCCTHCLPPFEGAGIIVDHKEHEYNFLPAMFEKHRPGMVRRLALMLKAQIV